MRKTAKDVTPEEYRAMCKYYSPSVPNSGGTVNGYCDNEKYQETEYCLGANFGVGIVDEDVCLCHCPRMRRYFKIHYKDEQ